MASTSAPPSELIEVAPGFWNARGSFKILLGMLDLGTHMSICRLSSGRFLIIDTIQLTPKLKEEIDALTNNGSLVDGVIATHPYHTLWFKTFHQQYPDLKYYGTPRHLNIMKEIPWAGDVNEEATRKLWEPDVEMRIPAGSEFVNPLPPKSNHFSNVFVFHRPSKTIHNDDTIIVSHNPPFILKLLGFKEGSMFFHPSIKGVGLYPTPEAPAQFKCWVNKLIADWDFDNIVTAHNGNKIGGAKELLKKTLADYDSVLEKIAKKNASGQPQKPVGAWSEQDETCECG